MLTILPESLQAAGEALPAVSREMLPLPSICRPEPGLTITPAEEISVSVILLGDVHSREEITIPTVGWEAGNDTDGLFPDVLVGLCIAAMLGDELLHGLQRNQGVRVDSGRHVVHIPNGGDDVEMSQLAHDGAAAMAASKVLPSLPKSSRAGAGCTTLAWQLARGRCRKMGDVPTVGIHPASLVVRLPAFRRDGQLDTLRTDG